MIERKVILEQPELNRSGILGVKIAKLLIEDGVETSCEWHRTSIPPDIDPQMQMDAVNAHLASMEPPLPPISQEEIEFIKNCHTLLKNRFSA